MSKEIKITIGNGGKVKITTAKGSASESAGFTEKLAKDLGDIEERHKGHSYEGVDQGQNVHQH